MCLLINNTLAITENDANQFVVDIGNQAIKILKIPVDDKEKRKKELQHLLQEKFDMPFIAKIILAFCFRRTSIMLDVSLSNPIVGSTTRIVSSEFPVEFQAHATIALSSLRLGENIPGVSINTN